MFFLILYTGMLPAFWSHDNYNSIFNYFIFYFLIINSDFVSCKLFDTL